MELVKHETCQEYFRRRLSEGWKCISLEGHSAVLLSPDGIRRELDLRNDVETLRPNAPGDFKVIDNPPGVPHWDLVDEVDPDGHTTRVFTNLGSLQRDLYNLPPSSGVGTINKITVYFCVDAADLTKGHARASIKSDSTYTNGDEKTPSVEDTFETLSQEWATNPAPPGTDAWTWDDIDALQIGVSLIGNNTWVYCTQVYVEVDYTPPAKPHTFRLDPKPRQRMTFHPNLKLG